MKIGSILARPRFELGSKAPKASMLGLYNRRNRVDPPPGFPGISDTFYYHYNVMHFWSKAVEAFSLGLPFFL